MLKIAVLVSGGGTNLQAIIDSIADGRITDTEIKVVISNNPKAKALERAAKAGIEAVCISPKQYADRELFNDALLEVVNARGVDLIVLAGFMVVVPEKMIKAYRNRMINIHPSLIPSFCGTGYYGLHVHEAALKRGVKIRELIQARSSCRSRWKYARMIRLRCFSAELWSRLNGRLCRKLLI